MAPERLKVMRNGVPSARKLVVKPESFQALLELCSLKLSVKGEDFQATRLFTNDGFELEEDGFDVIVDGDIVVASSGEDYIEPSVSPCAPLLASSECSRTWSGGSQSTASGLTSSPHTPHDHSFSPAASPSPSGGWLGAATASSSSPPHTNLTVLQSAPLISRDPMDPSRVKPLQQLDLEKEREELCSFLIDSRTSITISFEPATTDNLRRVMTMGATVLHYSGHGEEAFLAFEDGFGGTHQVTPQLLASTCTAGALEGFGGLQLVFVCACHSQPAAAAFVKVGVPHVVAVRSSALLLDSAARAFTRHFYLALCVGKSVEAAFESAKAVVCAMPTGYTAPAKTTAERESSKFMLLGNGDHSHPLWPGGLPPGELNDRSSKLCPTNLPALSEVFVGRQLQAQLAVKALFSTKYRCVCLVGAGGIGKTALGVAVCHYARLRHAFPSGVHQIDARGLKSVLQLIYAIASALVISTTADAEDEVVKEELMSALSERRVLLFIDRCDHLSQQEHAAPFIELLSSILRRAPRAKLLLTCRRSLGIAGEQPLTISVPELSTDEAQHMLRKMDPSIPEAHAALIAELCGCMPLALRLCGCALSGQRVRVSAEALITRLQLEAGRLRELKEISLIHGDVSVEACIASSFASLSPQLQLAFLALCEFPGSFDEKAAFALLSTTSTPPSPTSAGAVDALRECLLNSAAGGCGGTPPPPPDEEPLASVYSPAASHEDERVALRTLVEESMVEVLPGAKGTPRYRLHELIRLYGQTRLAQAGAAGQAALTAWRRQFVSHFTAWLRGVATQFRLEDSHALLRAYDAEQHNFVAALSLATDTMRQMLPGLLIAGRQLLRHRIDHGSRRKMFDDAHRLLRERQSDEEWGGDEAHEGLMAEVLIEMAFCANNSSQFAEATTCFVAALLLAIGKPATDLLMQQTGLVSQVAEAMKLVDHRPLLSQGRRTVSVPLPSPVVSRVSSGQLASVFDESSLPTNVPAVSRMPSAGNAWFGPGANGAAEVATRTAPSAAIGDGAAALDWFGDALDSFEQRINHFLNDSGAGPTPADACSELAAEIIHLLGVNLDFRGSMRGAQLLFVHSLRIRRHLLGPDHPDVASSYNCLANLLRKTCHRSLGKPPRVGSQHRVDNEQQQLVVLLYRRAILIRERTLGRDSPALAATLSNLSVQLTRDGSPEDIDEGERLLRRGLEIRQQVYGEEHYEVAHSLNLLGNLMQYQRKDYAEAEKLYTKSLRIRCKYYSRHSERVGQTLNNLAALARAQGQPERAERLLVECLEIREKVSGGVHPETHKTAQQLMQLYRNQGRTEDVARIRKMLTGWQRQGGGVDADANWLRAQVKFGIENVPVGFKLHSRIVGMRNYLLKNIVRESGAQQVYLGSVKPDAEEAPPEELSVSTSGADGVSLCMPSPIAPSEAAKASFQGSVPASAAASSPIAASSNTQSLVELPTCAEHGPSSEWHHVSASRFSMSRDSLPSKPSLISASRGSSVRSDSSSSSDPPTTGQSHSVACEGSVHSATLSLEYCLLRPRQPSFYLRSCCAAHRRCVGGGVAEGRGTLPATSRCSKERLRKVVAG